MALQLKDNNTSGVEPKENTSQNPWDHPNANPEQESPYTVTKPIQSVYASEQKGGNSIANGIVKLIILLVAAGLLILIGRAITKKLMPEGTDVTALVNKPETELASELGLIFTDNSSWGQNMIQYSGGTMTIHSNEDLGVVYIDGKQVGVHINSNKYTIYGIQVGMGEKNVHDILNSTYKFDNYIHIIDDSGKTGTTTYFYYNAGRNDCISLVINDTTNRVVAMTYYNNYKLIMKNADTF